MIQQSIGILLMEGTGAIEESPKALNFQVELQNLSSLQAKIEETRRSLNQLVKLENNEAKSIEAMHKLSLMTARNKLNLFQAHAFASSKHQTDSEELRVRQEKVREIKQKEEQERKQIREQLKKNKENERIIVRNNSIQYDQAIRNHRKLDLQKKEQIVKEIKQEKQHFKDALINSRIVEKQQKEVALFNCTLAKIQRQPSLAKQLSRLLKQKQEMEHRVEERRQVKEKLKGEIQRLKKLKEEEVAVLAKQQSTHHYSLGEKALSTKVLFHASNL